jgi:hypothetical protein
VFIKAILGVFSLFSDGDDSAVRDEVADGIHFLETSVLQVPFFLMSLMRYISPALDQM